MIDFNWQCAMNLHPWTKWTSPDDKDKPATRAAASRTQERSCPKCGRIQTRKVE